MKTFQKPLSAEEEAEYIRVMRQGNLIEAECARQVLIERNLRLVAHIAKKYQNSDDDTEDLISIGTIGLIKAVGTFDVSKGSRLVTYAARCIDNELLMMLRSKKKLSKEVSLYEPIGTDREGNEISLLDVVEQEQVDIIEDMENRENIRKLSGFIDKYLTKREREIIHMRYGLSDTKESTQREIGDKLKISRSYVSRIEKRALKKLREGFLRDRK